MDYDAIQTAASIIGLVVGSITILGFLGVLWASLSKMSKKLDLFWEDWNGSEERAGRDKVPGVMERLNKIDGELKHNGGSTMKDAVKRIEQKLDRIEDRIEKGDQRFQEGNELFRDLTTRVEAIEGTIDL